MLEGTLVVVAAAASLLQLDVDNAAMTPEPEDYLMDLSTFHPVLTLVLTKTSTGPK